SPGFVDPQWESALPEHQQRRDVGLDGSGSSDRTSDEGLCADTPQRCRNSNISRSAVDEEITVWKIQRRRPLRRIEIHVLKFEFYLQMQHFRPCGLRCCCAKKNGPG